MGLNPLQNAAPRQQIPNEAPSFFSPFFEQPSAAGTSGRLSVWQPPPVETAPRSKAPNNRPLQPPQIPTVGATTHTTRLTIHSRNTSADDGRKKLYEPKEKKSMDEIMWLGSVTGFLPPIPPPTRVEASLRSKLVRKPEDKTSQASALTQATRKRLLEAGKSEEEKAAEAKKIADEAAREKRLLEWATKKNVAPKRVSVEEKKTTPAVIPLPQPVETTSKSTATGGVRASGRRGKVFMPVPQPIETIKRSNRPNSNHRPNLPDNVSSYAPSNPILPQPIETTKRSHRPEKPPVKNKKSEEETLWMGLPQPVETVRRSNRRSPLSKDDEGAEVGKRAQVSPKHSARHSTISPKGTMFSPQPVDVNKKTNRPDSIQLPQPMEVTRRSNRPMAPPIQKPDGPPTPTTSFFGPMTPTQAPSSPLPVPFESTRRSHRPISGRPLVPQPIETSRRSNRVRVPLPEMQIDANQQQPLPNELPQPVSVSRWTNREKAGARHLRRTSTDKPDTPGLYNTAPFVRDRERERRLVKKTWVRPIDHVSHLHEPIDSAPPSPMVSPQSSRCPSLSSSPTSSAASSTWDVASKVSKASRSHDRRESLDEGFAGYILGLERGLKKNGALGTAGRERERAKEESEYPFPIVTEDVNKHDDKRIRTEASDPGPSTGARSESSETIRPRLTAINTDPGMLETKQTEEEQDYPICHSPVYSRFKVPVPEPEPLFLDHEREEKPHKGFNNTRISTEDLAMAKPIGIAANKGNAQLPTPPDSLESTTSKMLSPTSALAIAGGPQTAPARVSYAPMSPSPGYTVASLPPAKKHDNVDAAEVAEELVYGVMRYLSLEFENVGRKYDDELSLYTGLSKELVRKDRKFAVKKYVERWVRENPEIECGEKKKGGLW